MSKKIIFIPGKNPKPEPVTHRRWLWRALIEGVHRVDSEIAAQLRSRPEMFQLGAWNHSYYGQHASFDTDEQWVDEVIRRQGASAGDIQEALSWPKTAIKLMYELGDRFHFLIPWIPDARVKSMVADTQPYFENRDSIAKRTRNVAKTLIREAAENGEQILLIGHSMGSIIAYEAMWELTHEDGFDYRIELFLTLGSPLGMRYVQKHLTGYTDRPPRFPAGIKRWKNVSAHGDLVSVDETVGEDFKDMRDQGCTERIEDYCEGVFNWYRGDHGLNVHRSYGYLVNPIVGRIIADWWPGEQRVSSAVQPPTLIAHRGYPNRYPENTLIGYEAVVRAGARMVELDVQLSADRIPVLHHDPDTQRMSGVPGSLLDMPLAEIRKLDLYYPDRFGDVFRGTRIATLEEFCERMLVWPEVEAFVEIKEQSIERFGLENVARAIDAAIAPLRDRCIVISFSDRCVEHMQAEYGARAGWVLPRWNARTRTRAALLAPEFLFVGRQLLPENHHQIWRGPWKWAVYVVDDPAQALTYPGRGIHYVETDEYCDLIEDPRLQGARMTEVVELANPR